jgi:hypothetical protein
MISITVTAVTIIMMDRLNPIKNPINRISYSVNVYFTVQYGEHAKRVQVSQCEGLF